MPKSRASRRRPGGPGASGPPRDRGPRRTQGSRSRPAARQPPAPAASGARAALARASRPLLVVLSRLPRWFVPVVMAALLLAGLSLGGPGGAVLLLLVAVFLGWLLALSWPVISTSARLVRIAVIVAVVAVAAIETGLLGL